MNKVETEKLTIYEVESFHKSLQQWCQSAQSELKIDLANVKVIDISAIQLLLSAQKSCESKSSRFELVNVSPEVCKTFHSAGCQTLLKGCA